MVELIEQSRMACDRLIDVTGRAVLQGVLQLCAAQVAEGLPQQGKRPSESVVFYGRQAGQLMLSDRNIQLEPPRLLTKRQGRSKEVEIPVYTAMQDQSQPGENMLDTLLRGVSAAYDDGRGGRGCGRTQACAGNPQGSYGKRHRGCGVVAGHRGARPRSGAETNVHHRWLEGSQSCD
jgi:hypothetical protein